MLESTQLGELMALSTDLSLDTLVEVHNEVELETALSAGAEIVGINNRDLHTFHTDLEVTARLAPLVPNGKIIVSESGISGPQHIAQVSDLGVHAVLVGEALVTKHDVGAAVRHLMSSPAEVAVSPSESR